MPTTDVNPATDLDPDPGPAISDKDRALISGRIDGLRMASDEIKRAPSLAYALGRVELLIRKQNDLST